MPILCNSDSSIAIYNMYCVRNSHTIEPLSFIVTYIVYCVDNGWCHVVPLVARPWSTPLSNIHLFYTLVVPLALSLRVWYNAIHLRWWITRRVLGHMFYTLVVIAVLSKYWVKVYMVHNYIHTSIGSKYTQSLILLLWLQLHIILIVKPNRVKAREWEQLAMSLT